MTIGRRAWLAILLATLSSSSGCGSAPKSFLGLNDPRGIVRARSVSLGEGRPVDEVVPALIERLNDTDVAVRISAFEELKRDTHQELGYVPWSDAKDREAAVARWRYWWNTRQAALANSRPSQ